MENETKVDVVDITGLDPAAVLAALYNAARPLGLGFLHFDPTPMTTAEARALIDEQVAYWTAKGLEPRIHFDYLRGRPLKIGLTRTEVRGAWLYDRDQGEGKCAAVVAELRAGA